MKNMLRFFIVFYVILVLVSQPIQINSQSGGELFVPKRIEREATLTSQSGNDIYFQSSIENSLLFHEYQSEEASFSLYSTDGTDRASLGGFNPFDSFQASNPERLYHVSNTSNQDLSLTYSTIYYDLTNESGTPGLENRVLFENEMSGLRFDATAGDPLILDLKFKGESEVLTVDILIISPSGEVWDYSTVYSNDFQTFINEFIPLVPRETGLYTLFLSPIGEDVILESLHIYSDSPIEEISSGFTDHLQGTETQTRFFKIANTNVTAPTLLDLRSQIFISEELEVYSRQVDLLGKLEVNYFSSGTGPFGDVFPSTIVQYGSNETYVAVTATPPNENDQFIAAEKEELGLAPGFDVDYAFWAEEFEVDEFLVNEPVNIENPDQPNTNVYHYMPTNDQLIGFNASNAASATFLNLDNPEMFYFLDSTNNDILNSQNQDLTLLPAGNYLVILSDSVQGTTPSRISTFNTLSININEQANYFFNLNEPVFFRLPVIQPTKEYFNFTYLDFLNMSVTLDMALYGSQGGVISATSYTFEAYANANNPVDTWDNNTEFGDTTLNSEYNIFQGYLRVEMTTNTLWNSDLVNPTVNSTDLEVQSSFSLERLDYLDVWSDQDTDRELYENTYSSGDSRDLNVTRPDILYVYDFTSSENPTGYHFSFIATNVSFTIVTLVDWTIQWHNVNVNTPTTIDGIDYYQYELEFGTNVITNFAILLIFDTSALNNGTYTTELEILTVKSSPSISIGTVSTEVYVPPFEVIGTSSVPTNTTLNETSLFNQLIRNPITYGVIAGVGIISAVIIYIIRNRSKTPI